MLSLKPTPMTDKHFTTIASTMQRMQWTSSTEDLSLLEFHWDETRSCKTQPECCEYIAVEAEKYKISRLDSSSEETGTRLALNVYVRLNGVLLHFRAHPQPSLPSQMTTAGTILLDTETLPRSCHSSDLMVEYAVGYPFGWYSQHGYPSASIKDRQKNMLNYFPVPDKVKRPLFVLPTDGSMPPVQMRAQRVPFSLRISEELDRFDAPERVMTSVVPSLVSASSSVPPPFKDLTSSKLVCVTSSGVRVLYDTGLVVFQLLPGSNSFRLSNS
ncbi:hypothetical protein T4A_291 [Trichinella pseudospiralis]|uniref:Uncharacterized protein n=1 Tax=Trichinella pseudospiralis TaxID=6337 RepID=A0A0V1KFB5_TRIPS|nr:hypothetical protein T4A_291 [Trichinella pseudospiralis]KRZ45820.1 hypothetical protein T4C_2747 [Trichinella pseudospiralis]